MLRHVLYLAISSAALAAACASEKPYIPESNVGGTLGGRTAASYPLSADGKTQGDLRVASYGISSLSRNDEDGKAIHLRLSVANSGNDPMSFDVRTQRIQLPDGRQIAPAYAASHGGAISPEVAVAASSSRTIDLFFPLPEDLVDEPQPPHFDVIWKVRVGGEEISQITPFDKVTVDPAVAREQAAENVLYGPEGYWYDPVWGPAVIGSPAWTW